MLLEGLRQLVFRNLKEANSRKATCNKCGSAYRQAAIAGGGEGRNLKRISESEVSAAYKLSICFVVTVQANLFASCVAAIKNALFAVNSRGQHLNCGVRC